MIFLLLFSDLAFAMKVTQFRQSVDSKLVMNTADLSLTLRIRDDVPFMEFRVCL